ncbi:MAG: electron transport complex subunit RsxE [Nitrospirae bacterium GWC2_46_6]|nr:MAG: electron transport complex subunit RsxE [Nitrospirae bacterium GWC2_46_6]OGW20282.1 MAG: electron transport complex subunit RsxE [Nitrospirae bacterium GWA2_46_11]OGW25207.1 MAG: electron transport complex subunit RsxE [Nitrospirae bacterium GWB2_47_37]HAK88008.1 electron transport complex subunit RsxE [Nitrospiraceae bacterium]HCL81680.1 electron transport complex subunit RsxE [Nitrospiraceae bacterium]
MAQANKVNYRELITNGIVKENTIFKLALSLCPSIAVTNNLKNGVLMGVAVLFVQVMVNITISLMRTVIHPKVRLPIFMLVISGWVTVTDLSMAAAVPDVYKQMGLYIQLIVAFASILARAEMFASKNKIAPSMADGIGMGIGFLFALTVISFFRELIGRGSLWGMPIINAKPLLIMILPAGGFFAVGILMALFNWIDVKYLKTKTGGHEESTHECKTTLLTPAGD